MVLTKIGAKTSAQTLGVPASDVAAKSKKTKQELHIYANTVLTPFAENVSTNPRLADRGLAFDIPIEIDFPRARLRLVARRPTSATGTTAAA